VGRIGDQIGDEDGCLAVVGDVVLQRDRDARTEVVAVNLRIDTYVALRADDAPRLCHVDRLRRRAGDHRHRQTEQSETFQAAFPLGWPRTPGPSDFSPLPGGRLPRPRGCYRLSNIPERG